MDELMNLMIADESPSEISDSIKNQLMLKFQISLFMNIATQKPTTRLED